MDVSTFSFSITPILFKLASYTVMHKILDFEFRLNPTTKSGVSYHRVREISY